MERPDIILIVLDTQRADRLGCYGHVARETGSSITPNIDQFSSGGTTFDLAISPAQWTIPSHASMFTGLYPTAHQVTQSNQALGPDRPHMAEVLESAGYETIGFCNNPLVGVVNNGFKRGFAKFYNYGGAIPSVPKQSTWLPWPANRILEAYTQFLRRISYPIQNLFARSDLAFRLSLNSVLTPLWSRMANFKGQNERSVRDVTRFLATRENVEQETPLFLFLNLMETHLPFWPPGEFVDRVAPYMQRDREARGVIRRWNREAFRWSSPLPEPLGDVEERVLNDMYDAEVAYQDDYLGQLFGVLRQRANVENTLTIIVSDHGEGLGEHGYFGHAFVAFQELMHVPLIMHWPDRVPAAHRIAEPVSARRIYHTVLDAAGALPEEVANLDPSEVHGLTLMQTIHGRDPEANTAIAEVYPPLNYAKALKLRLPGMLERLRCMELRRAVVKNELKLIRLSELPNAMFDLIADPLEDVNVLSERTVEAAMLSNLLDEFVRLAESQQASLAAGATLELNSDDPLLQRLRGLGYIE